MTIKSYVVVAGALAGFAIATTVVPAKALTIQECSAKYEAAKKDGSLGGKKWNDFRKSDCSADATPAATAAPAPAPAPAPKAAEAKPAPKPAAAPVVVSGSAVFPSAIDPKYASQTPHLARMHTCDDQYKANKATNSNGGLKWTEKGGGYYSQCNTKLKG